MDPLYGCRDTSLALRGLQCTGMGSVLVAQGATLFPLQEKMRMAEEVRDNPQPMSQGLPMDGGGKIALNIVVLWQANPGERSVDDTSMQEQAFLSSRQRKEPHSIGRCASTLAVRLAI